MCPSTFELCISTSQVCIDYILFSNFALFLVTLQILSIYFKNLRTSPWLRRINCSLMADDMCGGPGHVVEYVSRLRGHTKIPRKDEFQAAITPLLLSGCLIVRTWVELRVINRVSRIASSARSSRYLLTFARTGGGITFQRGWNRWLL